MLKMLPSVSNALLNTKCGEIFCISPVVYDVTCCLCAVKIPLDQFTSHFQMQHLALAEESINFEELEDKQEEKLIKEPLDNISVKEEDPADDPIKQEDLIEDIDDDISLQKLLKKTQKLKIKSEDIKESLPKEQEVNDENLEAKALLRATKKQKIRKPRKPRKQKIKKIDLEDKGENKEEDLLSSDRNMPTEIKTDSEPVLNEEGNIKDYDSDDDDKDKDWSLEEKVSDTESEKDNPDITKDELPYPCHTCKRSFRSSHGLRTHNKLVHNPNKKPRKPRGSNIEEKCDVCNKSFRLPSELRTHKWKHAGLVCDICNKPFTHPGNLARHKIRHTGTKDHKCKECGKDFFTKKELKSHSISHTKLMPAICEICGKQCRHSGILKAHMRRHTGERPAKCVTCGKCFYSIHDLNVHAVTHTSERPFKCDICGSTFQRKKALRVHKKIHSTDRKHVCKICGKAFAQSGGLKSHMRSHDAALAISKNYPEQEQLVPNAVQILSFHVGRSQSPQIAAECKSPTNIEISLPPETLLVEYIS